VAIILMMDSETMRSRVAQARVGRLSTVGATGAPHAVPVCYAVHGDTVYSAVDHKPKRTTTLRRIDNLTHNDQACLLVDEYSDSWDRLWWVRLDGRGRLVDDAQETTTALALLTDKYPQYQHRRPAGPVLALDVDRWRGWSAAPEQTSLVEQLELAPHPEGGWFRETWRSPMSVEPPGYPGSRSAATAIYFLLHPGEQSRWHVVRSAEIWLWHHGGPLELWLGGDGEAPSTEPEQVILGPDLAAGQRPQAVVPGGVWQAAAPAGSDPVLISCVVAPGFDFADFRML
jgi:uncharacterized protein